MKQQAFDAEQSRLRNEVAALQGERAHLLTQMRAQENAAELEGRNKDSMLRCRVPLAVRRRLETAAKASGVSLSRVVRDAVLAELERRERRQA